MFFYTKDIYVYVTVYVTKIYYLIRVKMKGFFFIGILVSEEIRLTAR